MPPLPPQHTAIPWYTPEQYEIMRTMLAAESEQPVSYDAYLSGLEHMEKELKRSGSIPVRIPIDPVEVKRWVESQNKRFDRHAFRAFAMVKLGEQLRRGRNN